MAKQINLSFGEMDMISIGMVLDMIAEYVDMKTPQENKVRKATQADINALKI